MPALGISAVPPRSTGAPHSAQQYPLSHWLPCFPLSCRLHLFSGICANINSRHPVLAGDFRLSFHGEGSGIKGTGTRVLPQSGILELCQRICDVQSEPHCGGTPGVPSITLVKIVSSGTRTGWMAETGVEGGRVVVLIRTVGLVGFC